MSWGTCVECGHEVRWRATRGARIADARCTCGGKLRGKGGSSSAAGRTYVNCCVCGRRVDAKHVVTPDAPFRVLFGPWDKRNVIYPAGSPRHSWHTTEADLSDGQSRQEEEKRG